MTEKAAGILLHVSSLPSRFGIGDLGPEAHAFVQALSAAGMRLWQILPINPTRFVHAHSPYSSASAFAGNPLLVSPELMLRDGYINDGDLADCPDFADGHVDFGKVETFKQALFARAFERFTDGGGTNDAYRNFKLRESSWLDAHAEFTAISEDLGDVALKDWPAPLRDRGKDALEEARKRLAHRIEKEKFLQFLFFMQWFELKAACRRHHVKVIGDIPIYVNADSADVWSRPDIFRLAPDKSPAAVAGVPPDYFSATGQRWGNPLYNWQHMHKEGFAWWTSRLSHAARLFDRVRIDHFRGFAGYWEIPATEELAVNGKWVKAPGQEFFQTVTQKIPELNIIAEDLGVITPDVTRLRNAFGFPGMKVLLFAFTPGKKGKDNEYLPHMTEENSVMYTGTHDNNTVCGWFDNEAGEDEKKRLFEYVGRTLTNGDAAPAFVELAFSSPAKSALVPMQDVLGLGAEARMNRPSTTNGNWAWRLMPGQFCEERQKALHALARRHKRSA